MTIIAKVGSTYVALAHAYIRGKREDQYAFVINALLDEMEVNQLTCNWSRLVVDFEEALWLAMKRNDRLKDKVQVSSQEHKSCCVNLTCNSH